MALKQKKTVSDFYPDWYHEEAPADSWRSILKLGDPKEFKAPSRSLYRMMKDVFDMTDDDFQEKKEMGLEPVKYDQPLPLYRRAAKRPARHCGTAQTSRWTTTPA